MSWRDHIFALALAAVAFLLYIATLAPSVATIFDDSLEFPLVAHRLAIAHPTGYPLYTLIIAMAARLLPVGDVAYRVNLVSALAGAGAVGVLYLAARQLGLGRAAATWSALVFATAETVWSQSVIAEVYALHLLLLAALIWTTLRWGQGSGGAAERGSVERRAQLPLLPAFLFGLGLAHHRMTLLWAPALAVYVWLRVPSLRRPGRAWLVLALVAAAPLLLYLYLPLRGYAGSLDGTYSNSLPDFLCWVTACQYQSFLTENPLGQSRDAAFSLDLLLRQLGPLNLVLLLVGILRLRLRPEGLFLLAGGALSAAFALAYRVADPEVFWLPVVLTGALWAGAGLQNLLDFGQRVTADRRPPTASGRTEDGGRRTEDGRSRPYALRSTLYVLRFTFYAFLVLLLAASLPRWLATARVVDRSDDWAVHDLGVDMLSQPLPEDATIIGILGEMTLLRYFQETEGLRPDVETIAADAEAQRLAAVEATLAAGRRPFLTRPLPEAARRWPLGALGPLIEVHAEPRSTLPSGLWPHSDEVGLGVRLLGWTVAPMPGHDPARQRLTVAWQPTLPLTTSLKVSPRLLLPDGREVQGDDAIPVHFAYHTTAWRAGEIVLDAYELPAVPGAAYRLILYHEADGAEAGRVELPPLQP